MIKDIAFTVYAVTDMKRARDFYEGVLGLATGDEYNGKSDENPSWVEYLVNDNAFAIGSSPDWKPSADGASVAFEVADFDNFIKKLKDKNISFKMEPMSFANCSMAIIEDPDKNKIVIHRRHSSVSQKKAKKTKRIKVKTKSIKTRPKLKSKKRGR